MAGAHCQASSIISSTAGARRQAGTHCRAGARCQVSAPLTAHGPAAVQQEDDAAREGCTGLWACRPAQAMGRVSCRVREPHRVMLGACTAPRRFGAARHTHRAVAACHICGSFSSTCPAELVAKLVAEYMQCSPGGLMLMQNVPRAGSGWVGVGLPCVGGSTCTDAWISSRHTLNPTCKPHVNGSNLFCVLQLGAMAARGQVAGWWTGGLAGWWAGCVSAALTMKSVLSQGRSTASACRATLPGCSATTATGWLGQVQSTRSEMPAGMRGRRGSSWGAAPVWDCTPAGLDRFGGWQLS